MEAATLWIALVGRAGVGKTHTIKAITFPLEKINGREIKKICRPNAKNMSSICL